MDAPPSVYSRVFVWLLLVVAVGVRVVVWVPDRLSPDQERIYRQLKTVEDPAPERIADADRGGFWSRVKETFRAG